MLENGPRIVLETNISFVYVNPFSAPNIIFLWFQSLNYPKFLCGNSYFNSVCRPHLNIKIFFSKQYSESPYHADIKHAKQVKYLHRNNGEFEGLI